MIEFIPISKTEKETVEGFHCDQSGVILKRIVQNQKKNGSTVSDDTSYEFLPGASLYKQTVDDKIVGADLIGGKI